MGQYRLTASSPDVVVVQDSPSASAKSLAALCITSGVDALDINQRDIAVMSQPTSTGKRYDERVAGVSKSRDSKTCDELEPDFFFETDANAGPPGAGGGGRGPTYAPVQVGCVW